ncbi:MAG: hydroxymethylbilane synthase [Acidobacteria bacterium]|nr:hydroxymethylbilane synthase [Acidobacteriota bacterium]
MAVIRIGTRASALALWQTRYIAARLAVLAHGIHVELVEIVSTGDRITDVPLSSVEGTGFFTATLERALAEGRVDVAVHSYKDLPVEQTPGLSVAAVPARGPVEDVLCARNGMTLATLPAGARVGTCSARRTAQVLALRPDVEIHPLRGNVPTRVQRVTSGELDAIVLARAGLVRLGLDTHVTEVFPTDVVLPAPAQGALAVQCRTGDADLVHLLAALDDAPTRRAVIAERTLLHALGGGCSVPVGAIAVCDRSQLTLAAGVFTLDGSHGVRVEERGTDASALGEAAARRLLALGAGEILGILGTVPVKSVLSGDSPC